MKIDAHQDLIYSLLSGNQGQTNPKLIKESDLNLIFSALFSEEGSNKRNLEEHQRFLESEKDFILIENKEDLEELEKGQNEKIGLLLHIEGYNDDVEDIEFFYRSGVRSVGLTHNKTNKYAGGCSDKDSGLTPEGKRLIKKCEEMGIILDLAHLNKKSFFDVLNSVNSTIIVSHANCFKLCPISERNLDDEQIRAVKDNGGVIGIFFSSKFLKLSGQASIEDVIDHIRYIAELVGVDYVGIGSDFGGILSGVPLGLSKVKDLKNLENKLLEKGFDQEEVEKIMGNNFLRVLKRIL